jgi:selenium metabolism protein YedF
MALLVLSDSRSAGQRADTVIPTCRDAVAGSSLELASAKIIPDDRETIVAELRALVQSGDVALILTAGGTGLAPRDNAPEATRDVIERPASGFAELLRMQGMTHTPKAALSRGIAGVAGRTLIINLPGSPKAVREGIAALLPILPHALETLLGMASECAGPPGSQMSDLTTVPPLDMRGKACPLPVVETRKRLAGSGPASFSVIVDNAAARENVTRMARSMGCTVEPDQRAPDEIHLLIARGGQAPAVSGERSPAVARDQERNTGAMPDRPSVVLISGSEFGAGDPELGTMLMRAFIKTLKELSPVPAAILFVNSGVKLTTAGSDLLEDLGELQQLGAEVFSCGTCLDYYHLKDKLEIGKVTNMFEIATHLAEASRIIRP